MIPLTRPDGTALLVNPDRIELVEETPDTVITLADGKKILVRETATERDGLWSLDWSVTRIGVVAWEPRDPD